MENTFSFEHGEKEVQITVENTDDGYGSWWFTNKPENKYPAPEKYGDSIVFTVGKGVFFGEFYEETGLWDFDGFTSVNAYVAFIRMALATNLLTIV